MGNLSFDGENENMLDSYAQVLRNLYLLQKIGIKFGLNRTEEILGRLGNPHLGLRYIHIGGTNGKGSVVAIISSILKAHNYKVGSYTSPHLLRFTERFRINWEEIPRDRVVELYERVKSVLVPESPPTFFEFVTAMAFLYFRQESVDWGVIEVGMGGRLDCTNVIIPHVSIITNVGFDHQEFLGTSLAAIAREKAGIIKENVPVITGVRQPIAQSVIKTTAYRLKAPLRILGRDFFVKKSSTQTFHYQGKNRGFRDLPMPLLGEHQRENAGLALAALEVLEERGLLDLRENSVREGLKTTSWPGRAEIISRNPTIILDGAHNPHGAESLKNILKTNFTYDKLYLVIGIMGDKDIRGILRRLLPQAEAVVFTKPRYSRAADPESLRKMARSYISRCYVIPDVVQAIEYVKTEAGPNDLICITGSLYFVGEVKEIFGDVADPITSLSQ
ncbi:MAG: bifunctional folylpolyglutamate synthase/dihydrofolate synthase [Syntrophobacterales bacterium]|nr:bifunctional folylpolyglutamate synthase/dihydrofolate synthase [Syntrophobacterales bacterium]